MQLRRQFEMPETDQRFLESLDLDWETAVNNGARWVFLHGYAIPEGYTPRVSHVAVQVPPGYPDACLDMFYFKPALASGKASRLGHFRQ